MLGVEKITGKIVSGLGEGSYFISIPEYNEQIREKLGFTPFPGTLNIRSSESEKEKLNDCEAIIIAGFESKGKKFGSADCYKASISDIRGAIIMPDKNKHREGIIEFIAPVKLRDKLGLKDNDKITIELK